jgi:hypothetical protein
MNLQDQVTQLSKLVTELTRKISVLENKIQGEGRVVLSKKELKVDRSTSTSEILNFKDQVNSVIDLAVPGDGKFLRALNEQYKASNISYEDIASALSPISIISGQIGIGTVSPQLKFHVIGNALSNVHYNNQGCVVFETGENQVQIVSYDNGNHASKIILSSAPTSGDNKHWIVSHAGPSLSNRFDISYLTTSAGGNIFGVTGYEKLSISTGGEITIPNLSGVGGRAVYADATGKLYC